MTSVQERIDLLRAVGVEIKSEYQYVGAVGTPERHKEDIPDTFYGVTLPFTAEEWLSIAQNEGENYVGGCCGQMSALQDQISNVFRFGGFASAREFRSIAEYARGHDGFESFEPVDDETFGLILLTFVYLDPWDKLGTIYNAVEPVLVAGELAPYKNKRDEENKEGSNLIFELDRALSYLSFSDLFEIRENDKEHHIARRKLDLAKIYPLVVKLKDLLETVEIDFDGFAVVNEDKELVSNYMGPCVYLSQTEAMHVLDVNKDDNLSIVSCRVTLKDGLILGE